MPKYDRIVNATLDYDCELNLSGHAHFLMPLDGEELSTGDLWLKLTSSNNQTTQIKVLCEKMKFDIKSMVSSPTIKVAIHSDSSITFRGDIAKVEVLHHQTVPLTDKISTIASVMAMGQYDFDESVTGEYSAHENNMGDIVNLDIPIDTFENFTDRRTQQ